MELSGKDIVSIIKMAGDSGVRSLKIGEIEISWRDDIPEPAPRIEISPYAAYPEADTTDEMPELSQEEQDALDEYQEILTDPGAWERRMLESQPD